MAQKCKNQDRENPLIYATLDCICHVAQEKITAAGEDSFCYGISENSVLLGVFDGCGGSGAKKYPAFQNRTGAYIGARAVAGAVYRWFENEKPTTDYSRNGENVKAAIVRSLTVCKENCMNTESKIKGSISKEFPTTAAIARCVVQTGGVLVECYWAGDSRVYLLDADGLAQLTADDLDDLDAFENISGDGVLTNVISVSRPFVLHSRSIALRRPCFLFAASDGCYGYIPSPMEFEGFLLEQLEKADSFVDFEENLRRELAHISGDDFSLIGAAFGFGTFSELKRLLGERYQNLNAGYLSHIIQQDGESRRIMWNQYRRQYYRFYGE